MTSTRRVAALISAVIVFGTTPLQAQFTSPSRVTTYNLTFLDFNQFLDASSAYQFTHNVSTSGAPTAVPGHIVAVKTLQTGFFSSATGNATVSHSVQSSTVFNAPWSTTGGPGTISFGYNTAIAPTFGESWIVAGVNNNRYTLDFVGGGSGWAASNVPNIFADIVITINGNWSQQGTGFGQTEFLGLTGAGYAVDKFFTHSGGVTTLRITNSNWNTVSPNVSFRLYGAEVSVVPEPASVALVACGLLGIATMARRRRSGEARTTPGE